MALTFQVFFARNNVEFTDPRICKRTNYLIATLKFRLVGGGYHAMGPEQMGKMSSFAGSKQSA